MLKFNLSQWRDKTHACILVEDEVHVQPLYEALTKEVNDNYHIDKSMIQVVDFDETSSYELDSLCCWTGKSDINNEDSIDEHPVLELDFAWFVYRMSN